MATIPITDASLIPSARAQIQQVTVGEAVTRGDNVYLNTGTNLYVKAKANAIGTFKAAGMMLCDVAAGQPGLMVIKDPELTIGGTPTVGILAAVDPATAGVTVDSADLVAGDFLFVFGIVIPGNKMKVDYTYPIFLDAAIPA